MMKTEKLYDTVLRPFVGWVLLAFGVSLLIKWANAGVGGALSSMPNVIGQSLSLAAIIITGYLLWGSIRYVTEKAAKIIERQWSSESKFAQSAWLPVCRGAEFLAAAAIFLFVCAVLVVGTGRALGW